MIKYYTNFSYWLRRKPYKQVPFPLAIFDKILHRGRKGNHMFKCDKAGELCVKTRQTWARLYAREEIKVREICVQKVNKWFTTASPHTSKISTASNMSWRQIQVPPNKSQSDCVRRPQPSHWSATKDGARRIAWRLRCKLQSCGLWRENDSYLW